MIRVLLLVIALCAACPSVASADTISPQTYRQRLLDVRQLIDRAKSLPLAQRTAPVDQARSLLRQTDAITLRGDTLAIDDHALADRIDTSDASLARAGDLVSQQILFAARAAEPAIDASRADAALRDAIRDTGAQVPSPSLLDAAMRALTRFFAGLEGPIPDLSLVWPLVGAMGAAVIFYVVATLGRGLGERVRSEVVLRERGPEDRPDPAIHLRAADEALASGRARDAIHALYLYALNALIAREAIRDDPALTDRELLVRAAAIPHADSLRDLVALYERAWFGLREIPADDARRARALAVRVAA